MSAETDEILRIFTDMLRGPTGDGKAKRDAGMKVHWTIDNTHEGAMLRHLGRYWNGERKDADSGGHPLVHLAWRALAVAWQEMHAGEIPGQAQFWKDVQEVTRQGGFINDRQPCHSTRTYGGVSGLTEPFDEARAYVEAAWRDEPAAKGYHPC